MQRASDCVKFADILPESVKQGLKEVVRNLREAVLSIEVASEKLRESVRIYAENTGKLVRPMLCLLTTALLGGDIRKAVYAATAIECVHIAALLQDDVIDKHVMRRGVETPYARFGPVYSMLASNIFIAKAVEFSLRTGLPEVQEEIIRAAIMLTDGESRELELKQHGVVKLSHYLDVILKKTAALIEASMVIGAHIARVDTAKLRDVRLVGRLLGLAYQLKDDLIDYFMLDPQNPEAGDELNIVRVLKAEGLTEQEAVRRAVLMLRQTLRACIKRAVAIFGRGALILSQLVRNLVYNPVSHVFYVTG